MDVFSRALEAHAVTVWRVALHNAPTRADAEDVTQEVFEKLLSCRKEFTDDEHLKAWLIRVTINQCRSLRRSFGRERVPLTPELAAPTDEGDAVLEAVRGLPAKFRNAIYLHYYEGYSAEEVGGIMGANRNTVLSWLSRGRALLKKQMIGGFDDE